MSPGKYRQRASYLDESRDSNSFQITVPVGGRLLQAVVIPQGDGIYSTTLNNVFLAHLVKKEEEVILHD